jgi:hypothetical protein
MRMLDRLRSGGTTEAARPSLDADARAVRATLDGMYEELGPAAPIDLRAIVRDLLNGEVPPPTRDIATLRDEHLDADEFYDREIAPSWDALDADRRADRLENFLDLCSMIEKAGDDSGIPADMAARTRAKTLLLAWAFDETYGYLSRLGRGEDA